MLGDKGVTDTLVTKIMLGVFGNVPAFDSYFRLGSNMGTFNEHSLEQIKKFYDKNQKIIFSKAKRLKLLSTMAVKRATCHILKQK